VFVLSRDKTDYDVWTLAIIDVSLFMISGAFLQPPTFLPLFLVALICLLYAFQRLAVLRHGSTGPRWGTPLGALLIQLSCVMLVAAAVFALFPRDIFRLQPGARDTARAPAPMPPAPVSPRPPASVGLPRGPRISAWKPWPR